MNLEEEIDIRNKNVSLKLKPKANWKIYQNMMQNLYAMQTFYQ